VINHLHCWKHCFPYLHTLVVLTHDQKVKLNANSLFSKVILINFKYSKWLWLHKECNSNHTANFLCLRFKRSFYFWRNDALSQLNNKLFCFLCDIIFVTPLELLSVVVLPNFVWAVLKLRYTRLTSFHHYKLTSIFHYISQNTFSVNQLCEASCLMICIQFN